MFLLILAGIFATLWVLLLLPPLMLHAALTGTSDRLYWGALWGVRLGMRLAGLRVRVAGLENIPPGVCLFVANHTSAADPPAVVTSIPRRVGLLAKKELFRIPIFGAAIRMGGLVPVDRSDREAAAASVDRAVEKLRGGLSFVVYPEGTRSPDGRLRPFKKGSFVMAIRAGVPIVPISVVGAEKIMRKGEHALHPGIVTVRFHPPIDVSAYTLENKEELIARVHAAVASGLPKAEPPIGPAVAASS